MRPLVLLAFLTAAAAASATPTADAPRGGDLVFQRRCIACHALEADANTPAGPTLYNLGAKPIAAEHDFNYSPALRALAAREGRWSRDLLDAFLADPEAAVPGTEMGFPGLDDAEERRAVIDWLWRRGRPG